MKIYRAAIIGCGRIGGDCGDPGTGSSRIASHAAAYAGSLRARLVAASDPDPVRRRRFADRWGVARVYGDHLDLLAQEEVDILSICAPASAHGARLMDVLDSGRVSGVLLEKPVAESLQKADLLIERAGQSRAVVVVNYVRRFCPAYQRAAADLQAGRLGPIQLVRGLYTKGVLNNGGHLLDLLRFFFGDPSALVPLATETPTSPDPTVSFRVSFPSGFDAWIYGIDHEPYLLFELDIVGTQGRMIFKDLGHLLELYEVEDTARAHGFRQLARDPVVIETELSRAIGHAVENLIESVETGVAGACTLEDARGALALALAARDRAVGGPLPHTGYDPRREAVRL